MNGWKFKKGVEVEMSMCQNINCVIKLVFVAQDCVIAGKRPVDPC